MAIARTPKFVLDCPDPRALGEFYSALLDWPITRVEPDWVQLEGEGQQILAFQLVDAADYRATTWPSQERPQQGHLDVYVDDLDEAEAATLALGATKHEVQPGTDFRVFLDPAGHTFCLCLAG